MQLTVDYVTVHELAHLKERNHSPEFWLLVERTVPDYEGQRDCWRGTGAVGGGVARQSSEAACQ